MLHTLKDLGHVQLAPSRGVSKENVIPLLYPLWATVSGAVLNSRLKFQLHISCGPKF